MILQMSLDIDLDLLRRQKGTLLAIANMVWKEDERDAITEAIEGVVSLVDGIQDEAAEILDPTIVFSLPGDE